MIQINNFLSGYEAFREYCDNLDYSGVENPADGVFYPGVSLEIPENIQQEVKSRIERAMDKEVSINAIFLRLSTKGMFAPHQAHHDGIMGQYSLMLYLNRPEHCMGGTSFVRHISGDDLARWEIDHSDPTKWEITDLCVMEPNKACIFNAELMHRAEPIGGFGDSPENGRLVLTAFFNEHP